MTVLSVLMLYIFISAICTGSTYYMFSKKHKDWDVDDSVFISVVVGIFWPFTAPAQITIYVLRKTFDNKE